MDAIHSGHVLVAEDTIELQLLERRILENLGVTVTTVANGQEAVEAVAQQPFDLILMDMQMPVMDGLEATRTLRAQGYQLPILALTANVMEKHRPSQQNRKLTFKMFPELMIPFIRQSPCDSQCTTPWNNSDLVYLICFRQKAGNNSMSAFMIGSDFFVFF